MSAMAATCMSRSDKAPTTFVTDAFLALCALVCRQAFGLLVPAQLTEPFEVGLIQKIPFPDLSADEHARFATLGALCHTLLT